MKQAITYRENCQTKMRKVKTLTVLVQREVFLLSIHIMKYMEGSCFKEIGAALSMTTTYVTTLGQVISYFFVAAFSAMLYTVL